MDILFFFSYRFEVLLFYLACPSAHLLEGPLEQVEDALGRGDDVEGGRDRAALLKVRDPKLAAGKLPFDVGLFLQKKHNNCPVDKAWRFLARRKVSVTGREMTHIFDRGKR